MFKWVFRCNKVVLPLNRSEKVQYLIWLLLSVAFCIWSGVYWFGVSNKFYTMVFAALALLFLCFHYMVATKSLTKQIKRYEKSNIDNTK